MSRIYHLSAGLCEAIHTSGEYGSSPLDYVASVSFFLGSPRLVTSFGASLRSQAECFWERNVDSRVDITPLNEAGHEYIIVHSQTIKPNLNRSPVGSMTETPPLWRGFSLRGGSKLERLNGFEPSTCTLARYRSTN